MGYRPAQSEEHPCGRCIKYAYKNIDVYVYVYI